MWINTVRLHDETAAPPIALDAIKTMQEWSLKDALVAGKAGYTSIGAKRALEIAVPGMIVLLFALL